MARTGGWSVELWHSHRTRWWRCRINRSLPPFDSLKIHIFHSKFQITRVFSKQNHAAAAPWLGHTCFRLNVKPSRKIHLAGVTVPCRGCTFNTWKIYIYSLCIFINEDQTMMVTWDNLQFRKNFFTMAHIYQQDVPVTLAEGKSMSMFTAKVRSPNNCAVSNMAAGK